MDFLDKTCGFFGQNLEKMVNIIIKIYFGSKPVKMNNTIEFCMFELVYNPQQNI